jgi:Peptidase M15
MRSLLKAASFAAAVLCVGTSGTLANDGAASPFDFITTQQQKPEATGPADSSSQKASRSGRRSLSTARSGPAGTAVKQIGSVSTACLKPQLMRIIRGASDHFGSAAVITSGYRPGRRSYHGKCMAADVQIAGVSPGTLARYFRAQPGVGGVGTYGHTRSVHVDVADRVYSWYHGRRGRSAQLNQDGCPCCAGRNQLRYTASRGDGGNTCKMVVTNKPNIVLGAARA